MSAAVTHLRACCSRSCACCTSPLVMNLLCPRCALASALSYSACVTALLLTWRMLQTTQHTRKERFSACPSMMQSVILGLRHRAVADPGKMQPSGMQTKIMISSSAKLYDTVGHTPPVSPRCC